MAIWMCNVALQSDFYYTYFLSLYFPKKLRNKILDMKCYNRFVKSTTHSFFNTRSIWMFGIQDHSLFHVSNVYNLILWKFFRGRLEVGLHRTEKRGQVLSPITRSFRTPKAVHLEQRRHMISFFECHQHWPSIWKETFFNVRIILFCKPRNLIYII